MASIYLRETSRFSVFEEKTTAFWEQAYLIKLDINCAYTRSVVQKSVMRREQCFLVPDWDSTYVMAIPSKIYSFIQLGDFENIAWEHILRPIVIKSQCESKKQEINCGASSYLVRKGLSRKAQFSLQIKKHLSKNPQSILQLSVPFTLIVETWNAFEAVKVTVRLYQCVAFVPITLLCKA